MLAHCAGEYPEYTRAHCALTGDFLSLDGKENLEKAVMFAGEAYRMNPDDEQVYKGYAACFVRKSSVLLEDGDLSGAYEAVKRAMAIEGFDDQSFALAGFLAKKLDELNDFTLHCIDLGIDPLREFDLSNVEPRDVDYSD